MAEIHLKAKFGAMVIGIEPYAFRNKEKKLTGPILTQIDSLLH